MFLDPTYLLIMVVSVGLGFATQAYIKSTFRKWSHVPLSTGRSGADVARAILNSSGLSGVEIVAVPGELTDHYDPRSKKLALSEAVYAQPSVAAAGVAAHEAGHAIQDEQGYVWGKVRTSLVPVVNFGSSSAGILILLGLFTSITGLLWLGIIAYSFAVLFQLVTLPVEFDASKRAIANLETIGMVSPDQISGARQVLNAAALTYVAAALISLLNLVYYFGLARRD
ncbi:MAG: zinc metallopeptidase [Coriobacteriia bacterium]|nr:zinc metallopeptidase [Coriobacteriia bacterium]